MEYNYVITTHYDGELFSTHRVSGFEEAANAWNLIKDHGNAKTSAEYTITDPTGSSYTKTFFVKS